MKQSLTHSNGQLRTKSFIQPTDEKHLANLKNPDKLNLTAGQNTLHEFSDFLNRRARMHSDTPTFQIPAVCRVCILSVFPT